MCRQKQIGLKEVYYLYILFFLATPAIFSHIGVTWISALLRAGRLAAYFAVFFRWLNGNKSSVFLLLQAVLYTLIFVSTVLNGKSIGTFVDMAVPIMMTVLFIEAERENIMGVWRACIVYFLSMILIEFGCILLFPDGMIEGSIAYGTTSRAIQPTWFFSNKNGLGKHIIYLLFFATDYIDRAHPKNRWLVWPVYGLCFITILVTRSVASILVISMMTAMLCLRRWIQQEKPRLFNVYYLGGVIALVFVSIMLLNNIEVFSNILNNVLKKSSTFGGRSPIWQESVSRILAKPVLGYGYLSTIQFRDLIGRSAASNAHNMFLTIAIYGGLAALLVLLVLLVQVFRATRRVQYSHSGILLTIFLFSFFTLMLFEHTMSRLYWFILYYACMQGTHFKKRLLRLY